jgi:hypothetical protein
MTVFEYSGDTGSRIIAWLKEHLRAIGTCINNNSPEAALVLMYSGMDALGLLGAPAGVVDATGDTFMDWCEKYIVPRIKSVDGQPITPDDLWGGRCGLVHTSTPVSKRSRQGRAHEFWYQFQDMGGANMLMNTPLQPLGIDVIELGMAFKEGSLSFWNDLNDDPPLSTLAHARAQHILRWSKVR